MTSHEAACTCGQLRLIARATPFASPCATASNASAGREAHSEFRHGPRESRFGSLKALTKRYARQGNSGRVVTFHFCPECGSSVFWEAGQRPDLIAVAVGMFADPDFEGPAYRSGKEDNILGQSKSATKKLNIQTERRPPREPHCARP
jgi:hypothetical protein